MRKAAIIVALLTTWGFAPVTHASEWQYVVRPGDTLWDVVEKYAVHLGYVEQLQSLNEISDPRGLAIGSKVRIPVAWLRSQPASAEVTEVAGSAQVSRSGQGGAQPLATGDLIKADDTITTGDSASVIIRFADGSTMQVRSASEVAFDTLSQFGDTGMVDTRARLQRGRVSTEVESQQGAASRFEISTPSATTAVRGTAFRVGVSPAGARTFAEVLEGAVAARNDVNTQSVDAGFGVVVEPDVVITRPRELLPAPDLRQIPDQITRVPLPLDWAPLDGAAAYRIQLSSQPGFDVLLADEVSRTPSASRITLASDGRYFLRVRGLDGDGLEGWDQTHRFELNAYPEPPFPQAPGPDATVRSDRPTFRWSEPVDASAYTFELASDAAFENVLVADELSGRTSFGVSQPLLPGEYFWRLATRDDTGELGPKGDVQRFRYVPPPPAPEPAAPTLNDKELVLRWPAGAPGQSYRLQMSRDKAFEALTVDETVAAPQYASSLPRAGTYYYRVATVDTDGTQGQYSTPQVLKVPFAHLDKILFGAWTILIILL